MLYALGVDFQYIYTTLYPNRSRIKDMLDMSMERLETYKLSSENLQINRHYVILCIFAIVVIYNHEPNMIAHFRSFSNDHGEHRKLVPPTSKCI